ncbi:MAG: nucleoside triphosphate pyrophosphohydrolase, partial [Actinomycetota bacterium]
VAEHCRQKLIRRHPHVFGEVQADDAATVLRNWDAIKSETEGGGAFGDLPETLPSTLYAKKVQRRAGRLDAEPPPEPGEALRRLRSAEGRDDAFEAAGEMLFASVAAATEAGADPELALRAAADRYASKVKEGEARP